MPEKFVVDGESVRGLAKLLEETGLTEIEYQVGTQRVRVVRAQAQAPVYTVPSPAAPAATSTATGPAPAEGPKVAEAPTVQGESVKSPMVGTVYLAPEPGAANFVKAGDQVKKGDTLLIVEAMKVMNPIRAPRDGKVVEVSVQDGSPVEFGEPLVVLE
jgi:acetyl-CoA carboxylase biotin carboxyl carrier protein